MRKRLLCILVLIVLLPVLPLGSGTTEFQGGLVEVVLALTAPSFERGVNLTIPVDDHLLNATFNVTGMAALGDPAAYPEDLSIRLNETVIWEFNGTGYGPLGRQELFSGGAGSIRAMFGTGGGTDRVSVRLPAGAIVKSAVADVLASAPRHWTEILNFTMVPEPNFPISLDCAGDVNGDGFDDIILGSPGDDAAGTDAGRAYLHFGGTDMNGTPDVIFTGVAPGDRLGWSVSGAGDVNGDGYDDVVVSAVYNDTAGSNAGRAYLFFGGPAMDSVADVNLTGELECDFFGISVSGAGDVNGDGCDDVIIGSCDNDAGLVNSGRAYIYFGGKPMDNVSDVVFTGGPTDGLGNSVSDAGDVNRDGYDDVIVGAPGTEAPYENTGRAYVFLGGPKMDNIPDVTFNGTGLWDEFGVCVCNAGDLNNDGYPDVAVGADDWNSSYAGRVEVFFGGKAMDGRADLVLRGAGRLDSFGWSVSGGGDVNCDGYDDLLVGAELNGSGASGGGRAYIFFGGAEMDANWDEVFSGFNTSEYLGRPIACAGDVNNDSFDDILFGGNWGRAHLNLRLPEDAPGPLDSTVFAGDTSIWAKAGNFNESARIADFTDALNGYLQGANVSGVDMFGNRYIDVPFCISAKSEGELVLSGLTIVYEYNARIPDFSTALNEYIQTHMGEEDAYGNISVPLKVSAGSPGRVKLSDLQLVPNRAPTQVLDPVTVEMDEDTSNTTIIDLRSVFMDDATPVEVLDFSLVSVSNSSIVNVTIQNDRYVSADALTGDANDNWTGTVRVVVACRDAQGLVTESRPLTILVRNVNDPPVITSSPALIAMPGVTYSYDVVAAHGDSGPLEYILIKSPADMTIDPVDGTVRWLPRVRGMFQVTIQASDGTVTAEQKYSLEVLNGLPVVTSAPPLNATTDVPYVYDITATDPNLDTLIYSVLQGPQGMDIQSGNGKITWIPTATGNFDVSIGLWDGNDQAFHNFTITVIRGNRPPEIVNVSGPLDKNVKSSSTVKFSVVATDPDGDDLTYDWQENGVTIGTGPTLSHKFPPGEHSLMLWIGDGQHQTTRGFNFTVDPAPPGTGSGLVRADNPVIFGAAIGGMVAIGLALTASTEVGKYRLLVFLLPLYTRLHKEDVLDHGTREFIRGSVYADPGIHYNEILRRLKLARGTAAYHLHTLEREGFIRSRSDGRLRRFYPAEMKLGEMPPHLDKVQKIIMETVRESEGLGQREIARILGLPSSTVNRHIIKLTEMGLLKLVRQGMTTRCYLANGNAGNGQQIDEQAPAI